MKHICVFCGSSGGFGTVYVSAAQRMGAALARRGLSLVYGGGKVGLMGAVADAALAAGGRVVGVIPEFLVAKELAHPGLTQMHVVASMHERKALMAELSDAFVAMPGGFGTFEEFCEVLTWGQLGLHHKPNGLLNVEGYYDPLVQLFDHAVAEGFLGAAFRALVLEAADADTLLDLLVSYKPRVIDKWVSSETQT